MDKGGGVLYLIFFLLLALWFYIIERFWYFRFSFKKDTQLVLNKWQKRPPANSVTSSLYLRMWKADLSGLRLLLNKNIPAIKVLVALCPLMGLLGTVTGMVAVFEVMAEVGTGNARLMASGISMATIPTMAGMVGALSGIFVSRVLENRVQFYLRQIQQPRWMDYR